MDEAAAGLRDELGWIRKAILRQGHALDLLRETTRDGLARLDGRLASGSAPTEPSAAQLRTLIDLAQAVESLRALLRGEEAADEDAPGSLREGLDFLAIRVTNLQRSFDLRQIPTSGCPFDDRIHRAEAVRVEPSMPDGAVLEELFPGYTLAGRVLRPALVVVNRRAEGP